MRLTIFVKTLGNSPKARIISYLIRSSGLPVHQSDVIRNSNVSKKTIIPIWKQMIKEKIILYNRTIGKAKLYTLNKKELRIQKLIELYNICLEKEVELGLKESMEVPAL